MVACGLVDLEQSTDSIPAVAGGQPLAVGLMAAFCGVGHAGCTACVPWVAHFANFDSYLAAACYENFRLETPIPWMFLLILSISPLGTLRVNCVLFRCHGMGVWFHALLRARLHLSCGLVGMLHGCRRLP